MTQALAIQAGVVLFQALAWWLWLHWWPSASPALGVVALVQGVLSAMISFWIGMALWWWLIQLIFPLVVLAAVAVHWPVAVYAGLFSVLWLGYWHTFRTQVPYYPSSPAVWRAVQDCLPAGRPCRAIDLGSGLGGLVLHLARTRSDCRVTGAELAPLPWLTSRLRAMGLPNVFLRRVDYHSLDLGEYDLVFAYLSPAAMPALWRKAQQEMRPGSVLLSYEFVIPDQPADRQIHLPGMHSLLYAWYI